MALERWHQERIFLPEHQDARGREWTMEVKWSVTTEEPQLHSGETLGRGAWGSEKEVLHTRRRRIQSSLSADLLYLHDGSGPRGGAVVVVDIICSSLSILPLLPSRW